MKKIENRIHYVDRLKGIAMLLVVMGHVAGFRMGLSNNMLTNFIQTCQMPLFMFISGFLFTPYTSNKRLITKILGFVLPLFVFGLSYTFFLKQVDNCSDLLIHAKGFLLAPAKNGYWYLMSLSVFCCFMPLFSLNKSNQKWVDILIAFSIYAIYFVGWKKAGLIGDIFCLLNCTDFFPFFIMGFLTRKYKLVKTTNSSNKLFFYINSNWLFSISLITYLILFNVNIPNHWLDTLSERFLIRFCAVIIFCTLIVKREDNRSKIETALEAIGKNTLDVYVIHYFIIQYISFSIFSQWVISTGNILILILVTLVVSISITFISIWIGHILRESIFLRRFAFGDFK